MARGDHDHIPALPPIAAIGSSFGHMGLSTKGHATMTSVSRTDADSRFIVEHELPDTCGWLLRKQHSCVVALPQVA